MDCINCDGTGLGMDGNCKSCNGSGEHQGLTVEEIKKIFENFEVEGFSRHERSCSSFTIEHGHSSFEIEYDTGKGSSNTEVYELFLQRVIEGINKKIMYHNDEQVTIDYSPYLGGYKYSYLWLEKCEHKHSSAFETVDQAKEQAIKYILEKL